jgi:hypothetical protein
MTTPVYDCSSLRRHLGRSARNEADQQAPVGRRRALWRGILAAAVTAVLSLSFAPLSTADPTADLRSEVDSARSGACAQFQSDPVLEDVARRSNGETDGYIVHIAKYQPFEDPMPVLHDLGYTTGKAKLLVGYGDTEAKAIKGALLEGFEAIPDCTYTKYGVHILKNDDQGYVLASVLLAGA